MLNGVRKYILLYINGRLNLANRNRSYITFLVYTAPDELFISS